jgi:hypothetical protein
MNYIDEIVFRMFKTLTDEQKYDLLEKLTLENKELKKQLTLTDVVKPFYCANKQEEFLEDCKSQCEECRLEVCEIKQ